MVDACDWHYHFSATKAGSMQSEDLLESHLIVFDIVRKYYVLIAYLPKSAIINTYTLS